MERTRLWIIGAVAGMVIVVALGFVVGIQPQLAAIGQADAQRAQIVSDNDAKRADLQRLKTEYTKLPQLKAQLSELRGSVPDAADIPAFIASLHSLAVATKTTVSSITVSDAQAYQKPKQATASKSQSSSASSTSATAKATSSAQPVTDPRITDKNFVAIPISLQVSGSYARALDFVDRLQHGPRLFLVTTFSSTGSGADPSDATGGGSATPDAWNVAGYVYVLLDSDSTPAPTAGK